MPLKGGEWQRWLDWTKRVKDDLGATLNDRSVFREFFEIVAENEKWIKSHDGLYFCDFIARSYVARAALGVRRVVKRHRDAVSLVGMLEHMRECASDLTYTFYLKRLPRKRGDYMEWQRDTFGHLSADGRVISADLISSDLTTLETLTKSVEGFADKEVAHLDQKRFKGSVTFNDLDAAIEGVNKIVCKYILFLTGHHYDSLEAVVQFPWQRVFDAPLREHAPAWNRRRP